MKRLVKKLKILLFYMGFSGGGGDLLIGKFKSKVRLNVLCSLILIHIDRLRYKGCAYQAKKLIIKQAGYWNTKPPKNRQIS